MQRLYTNGTIITMAQPQTVEAVLTENGRIIAVGELGRLQKAAAQAQRVDLKGHTLLPAFIDAHSHLTAYANSFLQVALEDSADFEEIAQRVRRFIAHNHVKPGQWVLAKGYDHNALKEGRHPTLAVLDACAPENPLVLQHASGHVGVFNSAALRQLGVTPETPAPEGGRIERLEGRLTGYMEENAFISYLKKAPMADPAAMLEAYQKAQAGYAAHGITTVQEGLMVGQLIPLYQALLERQQFYLDVVGYADVGDGDALLAAFPKAVKRYDRHFKLGGYKIILDGSPQGRTAWMRTPYLGETPGYCGYGVMKDEAVLSAVKRAKLEGMQLLAHCNGDAAAQQYLQALERCPLADLRPVMIHAQLLGWDQLEAVKALGVIPSFFAAHVYHWGDIHLRNFGMARAAAISPARSALSKGIRFTFHQDTPVIQPDMLETVWCAANRQTKAGVTLGAEERISVYEALKAVTLNAAYQYLEEHEKGSLEQGKSADFVVLDQNPLAVDSGDIRSIKVLQTIKGDQTIYAAENG